MKLIAVVTAGLFAAGTLFAGDHDGCEKKVGNEAKAGCDMKATFAKLELNADQKSKLDTWKADCDKAGCTKESMTAFMKKAEGILTKEQYGTLKSECEKAGDKKEKTQT